MWKSGDSLSGLIGPTGIGALGLLGVFAIVDGVTASPYAWAQYLSGTGIGLLLAPPLLAITFVCGLLLLTAADILSRLASRIDGRDELLDSLTISRNVDKDSIAAQRYIELRTEKSILLGSSMALPILGLGTLSDSYRVGIPLGLAFLMFLVLVVLAVGCFLIGIRRARAAHELCRASAPAEAQGTSP